MGTAISCGFDSDILIFLGWGITLLGLIIAFVGYYFSDD